MWRAQTRWPRARFRARVGFAVYIHDFREPTACHDDRERHAARLRSAPGATGCARVLCAGARCRSGHDASVHDSRRQWPCRARHCHAAVPVSLYGTRLKTAGRTQTGACHRPRGGSGSIPVGSRACSFRGWQILRWPNDFASASRRTRARSTSSTCKFRCSSCKELVMISLAWSLSKRSANSSVSAQHSSCFRMRIIRFTYPRARDARILKFEPNCWTRWPPGST